MGLFDKITNAINDPNLQASVGQLGSIVNTVRQSSDSQGLDPATTQAVMSVVGTQVRKALQEKRQDEGEGTVKAIVDRFGGTDASLQAVQALFSPQRQETVAEEASRQTGANASTVQALLPILVPLVLNFLKTGSNAQNPASETNPVLSGFLDADGDGDVDMGDALRLASQFVDR
ncbi:DUF937 domain-containing protein [Baaleninema simplex]|uniref:DUF937 domain-containing protein n=1 Tax=Baaleninema simplex TaxID=2862350 RepID=UPI000344BC9F|nr:DUF937 domain-containing protein [Baaleninema simplex]